LDIKIIYFGFKANDPFQFLAKFLSCDRVSSYEERLLGFNRIPVSQDASASAYQIMSYLLLNKTLAKNTNLISSNESKYLYTSLRTDLLEYLKDQLHINKYNMIESKLSRKLIKSLFMPLIYGKTVLAMSNDIREAYGSLLSGKDYYAIAQHCNEFFRI